MKKNIAEAVILIILSLILAVGVLTFLHPCAHEDGSAAPCDGLKTGLPLLGAGCAGLGILLLVLRGAMARIVLFALAGCGGALTALTPGTLIRVCGMDSMRCRMVTQPAARILGILIAVCALIGLVREIAAQRKRGGRA